MAASMLAKIHATFLRFEARILASLCNHYPAGEYDLVVKVRENKEEALTLKTML
jgi:hypothetical protein